MRTSSVYLLVCLTNWNIWCTQHIAMKCTYPNTHFQLYLYIFIHFWYFQRIRTLFFVKPVLVSVIHTVNSVFYTSSCFQPSFLLDSELSFSKFRYYLILHILVYQKIGFIDWIAAISAVFICCDFLMMNFQWSLMSISNAIGGIYFGEYEFPIIPNKIYFYCSTKICRTKFSESLLFFQGEISLENRDHIYLKEKNILCTFEHAIPIPSIDQSIS